MRSHCLCAVLFFSYISIVFLSVPRSTFQSSWVLFRCKFANISCAAMCVCVYLCVFFFSFESSFLLVLSGALTLNMITEVCRGCDGTLGPFHFFMIIEWSDPTVNSVGNPLLGKLANALNVFCLWIIHDVWKMSLQPFSDWGVTITYFLLSLLMSFHFGN